MNKIEYPSELIKQLLNIMELGIVNTRYFLENNDCASGIVEANHIHNIPSLIGNFSYELLAFYLDIEVREYRQKASSQLLAGFEKNWQVLQSLRVES